NPAARPTVDHSTRPELAPELREVLLGRVVELFGLLFGVEVVEVAEEFVEAVVGRKELVAVAKVVLAELPGNVPLLLQRGGDRRICRLQPEVRSRHPYLGQSGPVRILSADERCATCSATLLTVVVGETHTLRRDPVDIGRAVPHQALAVAAHVRDPD